MTEHSADVVIVGAGIAGAILALELGKAGIDVLLVESGVAVPPSREENVARFYLDKDKFPESPYSQNLNALNARVEHLFSGWKDPSKSYLDQSTSDLPFGSTYERRAGGTVWHWLGTSLRLVPNDFQMNKAYGLATDWPISYADLAEKKRGNDHAYYEMAEAEIGVAACVTDQDYLGISFAPKYKYPNPPVPASRVDQFVTDALKQSPQKFDGCKVNVYSTPAGRQTRPTLTRRACAGNTSCVPICPIQAKYDPTITLHKAFSTGHVHALFQAIATRVNIDPNGGQVTDIEVMRYTSPGEVSPCGSDRVRGKIFVIAGNGIETPRLLLHSRLPNKNIGKYLMDHPFYLRWGLAKKQKTFPYRGPLSTSGIESLRDGVFRKERAAFRIEIGNDGWNLTLGDPYTTTLDWIDGTNQTLTNGNGEKLHGRALLEKLNDIFTHQFRFGFLIEQLPDEGNAVTLSTHQDPFGIPRPKINYNLSDYTRCGFQAARAFTKQMFDLLQIDDKSQHRPTPSTFHFGDQEYQYDGAGHIMGTYRMGTSADNSVVNREQRSWEHPNLYLIGSGTFPTTGTANPTLTIAALSFWAADTIKQKLKV